MLIFSVLTFVTICLSVFIKNRKEALNVYAISCLCESLYCMTVGALTGTFLGVINFIRTYLFANKDIFSKKAYFVLFLFFEFLVIFNCVITFDGLISLFPTMASIIGVYCLWVPDVKYLKISSLIKGLFYSVYYVYYDSWILVWGYMVVFLFSSYALIKCNLNSKSNFLKLIGIKN